MAKICLVTEEIAGSAGAGGIGAAMYELAAALARGGHMVDLLYLPIDEVSLEELERLRRRCIENGIKLIVADCSKYIWGELSPEKKSYVCYATLRDQHSVYDYIHFHDYKGIGFYSLAAKRQGLAFGETCMVVQLHGPTRWALEVGHALFTHEDQLRIDHLERHSIEWADEVVSPSAYLIKWLTDHGFRFPANGARVLRNVCTQASWLAGRAGRGDMSGASRRPCREIIFFGRHEGRKGLTPFCDALDQLNATLRDHNVKVTFLGKLGIIDGHPSGVVLTRRAARWEFPVAIRTKLDRYQSLQYLAASADDVVVIASPEENSPYTVLETAILGRPLVTSAEGGAGELLAPETHAASTCKIDGPSLAAKLREAVEAGLPRPVMAESVAEIEQGWLEFHRDAAARGRAARTAGKRPGASLPKVVFGITHYERPGKLMEAILSAMAQTYKNIEIVVVDDGSKSPATRERLQQVEAVLQRVGGRLLQRENGYLGAARNTIIKNTDSPYIVFLDDDDIALPKMVEILVSAALATDADIVGCFNLFLEEARRAQTALQPERFEQKLSYAPAAGPLSLAAQANVFGAATALLRRSAIERIHGYSELRDVGHEDYELYVRAAQAGLKLEVVPEPLYLYEVGRPSMISRTSVARNFKRIADAISTAHNPEAWTDLVNLVAGRAAHDHSVNRRLWEYQTDPNAGILLDILKVFESDEARYCELLAEYATRLDAPWLASAWRESRTEVSPAFDPTPPAAYRRSVGTAFGRAEATVPEVLSADIAMEIALGRAREALTRMCEELAAAPAIGIAAIQMICAIIRRIELRQFPGAFDRLRALLEPARLTDEARGDGLALWVALSWALGDSDAVRGLRALCELEERDYLEKHPDIALARAGGDFPLSGIVHFVNFGLSENRRGFSRVVGACRTFGELTGQQMPLSRVISMLGAPLANAIAGETADGPGIVPFRQDIVGERYA
jgi:glycosyltransferase involved in cell wall biosynthesis